MAPESTELIALAQRSLQEQDFATAADLMDQAAATEPGNFDLLQMAGVIHSLAGKHLRAAHLLQQVADLAPASPEAHANLARALWRAGRPADALSCHARLDELGVQDVATELDRATLLSEMERFEEALESCVRATQQAPGHAPAWSARGSALHELEKYEDALQCFEHALALDPALASAWANKALTLHMLQQYGAAMSHHERALDLESGNARTWSNCGASLLRLGQSQQALDCCDKALALWPQHALPAGGQFLFEGEASRPHRQYIATLFNRANLLLNLDRHDDAMEAYARLLELAPETDYAPGAALFSFRTGCNWNEDEAWLQRLVRDSNEGKHVQQPFVAMIAMDDPALQRSVAERFVERHVEPRQALWSGEHYRHERLRVAYLSADFRRHPTAYLAAGVFEHHDRSRLELTAVALGTRPPDEMTGRIRKSFDHFIDAGTMDDGEIAALLREREIDVLVDLMGHSKDSRPGVFAWRPAPVHVAWLGYPGTSGLGAMDFLLADRHVIPPGQQAHYTEQVVYFDACYQCTDNTREIADAPLTRQQFGLPDDAFVFCCFNQPAKLTPATFSLWMEVLASVPGSVLWLLEDNRPQVVNLRREAAARGIDPQRLVFSPRLPQALHLARHRLADLALDTLPCNAHTTTSDALWAGLPVLTCTGTTFAGRVATSALHAAGLPELVCDSLQEYRRHAIALAGSERGKLDALTRRLHDTRQHLPLFDTAAFTRQLESIFASLHARRLAS
ncbi:tetratricopeptide repeat protein [Lacisediminimonas profundi]|uniref:tetratricopeptide repeat protein n=1 Tax=Lacisediminimonas profundi TaxID=2603856 RepID=UPI0013875A31|nr:glycosyltransferase family 41 protein [Lacisediminimonas profundi]